MLYGIRALRATLRFPVSLLCNSCNHFKLQNLFLVQLQLFPQKRFMTRTPLKALQKYPLQALHVMHFRVGAAGPSVSFSSSQKCDSTRTSRQIIQNGVLKQPEYPSTTDPTYEEAWPSLSASVSSGLTGKKRSKLDLGSKNERKSVEEILDYRSSPPVTLTVANSTSKHDGSSLPTSFGKKHVPSNTGRPRDRSNFILYSPDVGKSKSSGSYPAPDQFDICFSEGRKSFALQGPLKREKKWVKMGQSEVTGKVLRAGMVLLKDYITIEKQVEIIKKCRELGLGPGGFYQPFYRDGAKLRLQMMCLGLNWDPETRLYEDCRPIDGSKPPVIPDEFILLVEKAIHDSHDLLQKDSSESNVEKILPGMSPDICIVNFYRTSGRLGLHQDRDETKESLCKGLPVVSFSIGDSAEFLYGDQRDVEKADKILLESGDVLIFGGRSRHVFHGVPSIVPNSAPSDLSEITNLRPGRLNLTFRQY